MHLQETGWELENQVDLADHIMAPFLEFRSSALMKRCTQKTPDRAYLPNGQNCLEHDFHSCRKARVCIVCALCVCVCVGTPLQKGPMHQC